MELAAICDVALGYIEKYHRSCDAAILFGSYSSGTNIKTSDIDLAIIDQTINFTKHSTFNYEGFQLDVVIFPLNKVVEILREDLHRKNGMQVMLLNGIVLKDSEGLAENLLHFIKFLMPKYYPRFSASEVATKRINITNALEDLEDPALNSIEKHLVINRILSNIFDLNLNDNACGHAAGKHKARLLKAFNKGLHNRYIDTLDQYIRNNDADQFKALIEEQLCRYGGKLTPKEFINVIHEGARITITFYEQLIFHHLHEIADFFRSLKLHIRYAYIDVSGYVICLVSETLINYKNLELKLHKYFKVPMGIKFFKVNLDPQPLLFSNAELVKIVEEELANFYERLYRESNLLKLLKDEKTAILLGLFIGSKLSIILNLEITVRRRFFEFVLNSWLPEAYDINNDNPISLDSLEIIRRQVLITLQKTFAENVDEIINFLDKGVIPVELASFENVLTSASSYFSESFLPFINKMHLLASENNLDLPAFELYYSKEQTNNNERHLFYIYKFMLDKFLKMLPTPRRYIVPYILHKV